MATIVTAHDPLGINQREVETLPAGELLLDYLLDKYPDGFGVNTFCYTGHVGQDSIIDLDAHSEDGYPLGDDEIVYIVRTPQTGAEAFVASFVVSLLIMALIPKPEIPEFQQARQSPNNSLTGQTNIARPLERIPDIYGTNRVYPDIIAPSYFEFIGNRKFLTEYFCIGRGEFDVSNIKWGDTLISDLDNATATVYGPNTRPTTLYTASESSSVTGQTIRGTNVVKTEVLSAAVVFTATDTFTGTSDSLYDFFDLDVGDTFVISGASSVNFTTGSADIDFSGNTITSVGDFGDFVVGEYVVVSGSSSNDGTYEISAVTSDTLKCIDTSTGAAVSFVGETGSSAIVSCVYNNNGTYTLASFTETIDIINDPPDPPRYTVVVDETTFTANRKAPNSSHVSTDDVGNSIGPFAVPGTPDAVWFNVEFFRGLIAANGDTTTVRLNFELQEIDGSGTPIGSAENNYIDYTAKSTDARSYTYKATPANPGGIYRATVYRLTDETSATDEVKWSTLYGMEEVTETDFGDVTTIHVTTVATEQTTNIQERELNAVVTRKLPTYSGGAMTTTTTATNKMADAVVHILSDSKMGNKSQSQIDLDGLYAIQSALDADAIYGDKLGRFCYTFSDMKTPVIKELETALNACRCFAMREGDVIRFGRDEAQSISVALFNQRNKKPDAETKTVTFQKPNDPDGILLDWSDQDTAEPGTVAIPTSATNPRKIEAAGIKNYEQAWNRAKYEYNRLIYQRTRIKTDVTAEGLMLSPGDRVENVDGTRLTAQGGEVLAVSGTTLTTSEPLDFNGASSASVVFRYADGSVTIPVTVTPGATDNQMIGSVSAFLRGDNDYQVGMLYQFTPNNLTESNSYIVQSITPSADGYVSVEMVNYADPLYTQDTETPT